MFCESPGLINRCRYRYHLQRKLNTAYNSEPASEFPESSPGVFLLTGKASRSPYAIAHRNTMQIGRELCICRLDWTHQGSRLTIKLTYMPARCRYFINICIPCAIGVEHILLECYSFENILLYLRAWGITLPNYFRKRMRALSSRIRTCLKK